jgi:uncharacterized protein YqeY
MKSKDALRTGTLRMIKTALKNREIEKRGELTEAEFHQVLKTLVKQRKEAIEQFEAGGRADLAEKERREIEVIQSYLPEALSAEEMEEVVSSVIVEVGAGGPQDIGSVMKEVMARLQTTGKTVDGKAVNVLVRSKLQAMATPPVEDP